MLKLKVLLCVLNLIFIFAVSKGNKVLTILKNKDYGNFN
nr:MAG TPA: hypothetical protein [Caudoviricetes sp.]